MFSKDLSLHHLVANLVKNVDERGRNIMCVRTLPSRIFSSVSFLLLFSLPCNSISIIRGLNYFC